MTDIVRHGSTSADLMNTILNLTFALKKGHNKKFVATRIVVIVIDMIRSDSLIAMITLSL